MEVYVRFYERTITMQRLFLPVVLFASVLLMIFLGCSPVQTPRQPTMQLRKQHTHSWLGVYDGTIVYVFGDITDKKGHEGFPVTVAFFEEAGEILFDMTTYHQNTHWLFHLPPALFRTNSIEFNRNGLFRGEDYQIQAAFTLQDKELKGTIKMFKRSQDGSLLRRGSYLLNVEKQNL